MCNGLWTINRRQLELFLKSWRIEADLYVSILSISRDQGFRGQCAFFKTHSIYDTGWPNWNYIFDKMECVSIGLWTIIRRQFELFLKYWRIETDLYVSILSISRNQGFRGQCTFFETHSIYDTEWPNWKSILTKTTCSGLLAINQR